MAASLVAILPAAGAAFGAFSMLNAFKEMAMAGIGGDGPVSVAVNLANPPLIAAALVAAVIAGALAVALARKSGRAAALPGLPFSLLVPILACAPALVLWAAESLPLDFLAGRVTFSSIAEGTQHLQNLLIGTMASAVVVIGFAALALARSKKVSRVPGRAAVWGGTAILLLGLAAAFYMRYSYLADAALRGHL